jgi:regulator of sirC expression with transglutaminase-like and TPR domain
VIEKEDLYMIHLETIRDQFTRMVQMPEDRVDLINAALLIARTAFPHITPSHYIALLDRWAGRLRKQTGPSSSAGEVLQALNRIMFEQEGFKGSPDNYYDPQNSFLNRVLERKRGIPITLSLVYSEVGRLAGFPLYGIALPGHFIAGFFHESGMIYIDPFNRGAVLAETECCKMIEVRFGREAAGDASWRTPASKKTILKRMLRNLKAIYLQSGRDMLALEMIQWIMAIDPDAPAELKERGMLYEAMGNFASATLDFKHYLEVAPDSEDDQVIKQKVRLMGSSPQKIH